MLGGSVTPTLTTMAVMDEAATVTSSALTPRIDASATLPTINTRVLVSSLAHAQLVYEAGGTTGSVMAMLQVVMVLTVVPGVVLEVVSVVLLLPELPELSFEVVLDKVVVHKMEDKAVADEETLIWTVAIRDASTPPAPPGTITFPFRKMKSEEA
jgi:hypothetical protein